MNRAVDAHGAGLYKRLHDTAPYIRTGREITAATASNLPPRGG